MIPPALTPKKKWMVLAVVMLPFALIGIGAKEQIAQAARHSNTANHATAWPNGVYLYGNSSQPNQLLHNYVVFEQRNGQVIGAFYSPQSDFTCFTGAVHGTQLEVTAIAPNQPTYAVKAQLSPLHALPHLSENDQRMLATCKQVTISLARGDTSVD